MAVELKIPTRKGLTLHTKKKFIEDDIDVTLDDSLIPQGAITITENGEYDVSNYETANVNTPVPTGTLEVTENGEHDVASYEKVNVNVAGNQINQVKTILDNKSSYFYIFRGFEGESLDGLLTYDDTENVTNMSSFFEYCSKLTTIPLINTDNVTNMENMFNGCFLLTTVPLLNTSNVTVMTRMFEACKELTSIPQFDTSSATKMIAMFSGCSKLTTLPLFDTSNVTDMYNMFSGCSSLTTIPQFNVENVKDLNYMFDNCKVLKSIQMAGMKVSFNISASTQFETSDLLLILNNLATITSSKTLTMGATNLAKLSDEQKAIATNKGWTLA